MRDDKFLDLQLLRGAHRDVPLTLVWPVDGKPAEILTFWKPSAWRDFVLSLGLRDRIPEIVAAKFRRAQILYFLAWLHFDLIKAGELAALATLELALNDRYGNLVKKKGKYRSFSDLLACMLQDGITDEKIPMVKRSGGSAIGFLNGQSKPSLTEIRNKQAHGDPFDGLPYGGLLELVRDLIEYAYRDECVLSG